MKFGVIACLYGCQENVDRVLDPFLNTPEVQLSIVHGQFKEYADMGYPNQDSMTIGRLVPYQGVVPVTILKKPGTEADVRNAALEHIRDCDFIWLLDGDEFYTETQIQSIIEFVKFNRKTAWFSLNFKNYVFDGSQWIDGFCPPRIFRTKNDNLVLNRFYWDNDVYYHLPSAGEATVSYKTLPHIEIPKAVAQIKHLTWLHSNGKKKWEYQIKHFGHCSYKWDNITNKLEFDLDFHAKHGIPLPVLNVD